LVETRTVRVDPLEADPGRLRELAAALRGGAVAAYPTETFYALGAAAFSKRAVARIYRLKGRTASKSLSVVVSGLEMVGLIAAPLPAGFVQLAGEFWPGPLTLVLPASAAVPGFLAGPGRTIAVRVPPLAWLRALVAELGEPLTATSANLAGGPEQTDPAGVETLFGGRIELVIDAGPSPGGLPSTIVDLASAPARVLREGRIPAGRVFEVLGR
jgi:L-threonylcarbamoyladenylate synthase